MKKCLLLVAVMIAFAISSFAQISTYILVRHAEKDTSVKTNPDPALSAKGEERANKLVNYLKKYSIDTIYSTNYIRTKSTVAPLAKSIGKEISIYNPADLKSFALQLLRQSGKTVVIVGHSNTTPALVNLLIEQQEYKDLDEKVYDKIFIVTINKAKGKTEVEVLRY